MNHILCHSPRDFQQQRKNCFWYLLECCTHCRWPHNTTERREGDPRRRLSQRCSKAARGAQCVGPSLLCVPAPKSPGCWDWRSLGSAVTHTLHTRPPPLSEEHSQQEPSLVIYGTDQEREGTLRRAGLRDGLETPRQKVRWERT